MKSSLLHKIFYLSLVFFLTACGFHLRGDYSFPPEFQDVYVSYAQIYDPFVRKLNSALRDAHVVTVNHSVNANYILTITKISEVPILQSTSTTGQTNTYNLQYTVNFEVRNAVGKLVFPNQNVQANAAYTLTSGQLLTSYDQQPGLIDQLQQDVISQILFRLSSQYAKETFRTS